MHIGHHPIAPHQAFTMIFVVTAILMGGYALALNKAYQQAVYVSPSSSSATPILARLDEETAEADEETTAENSLAPLADELVNLVSAYEPVIAIGVKDLTSGDYIGINDTLTMKSASLYKLFVGYETARLIDNGSLSWEQASGFEAGSTSVESCFDLMINISDNNCGRSLRKLTSANNLPLASLADAGFLGTNLMHDYPTTSALDVTSLLAKLENGELLTSESTERFISALEDQQINNRLPQGLDNQATVAHKTADLEGYSHDAGIVTYGKGSYVITVMSGPWDNEYTEAPPVIAEISRVVYEWFSGSPSS